MKNVGQFRPFEVCCCIVRLHSFPILNLVEHIFIDIYTYRDILYLYVYDYDLFHFVIFFSVVERIYRESESVYERYALYVHLMLF